MGNGCSALSVGFHTLPQTTPGGARDSDVQAALAETIGAEVPLHLGVDVVAERDRVGVRIA